MNVFKSFGAIASVAALLALGACTTPSDTHRHGPRDTMRNSAMPNQPANCPYETASHDMNRPHDTGPMPTAAHPGCQPDGEATPTQAPAQPQH